MPGKAVAYVREALAIFEELGDIFSIARALLGLAAIGLAQGQAESAIRPVGAVESLRTKIQYRLSRQARRDIVRTLDQALVVLGSGETQRTLDEGAALSVDEARRIAERFKVE